MCKTWIIVSLFHLLFFSFLLAEEKYDFKTDTLTYGQYVRKEWKALYKSVELAEKDGFSFYYLHLRGAFAAFYTQRYSKAVDYFEKAKLQNTGDDLVKQYYHLSALYAGERLAVIQSYNDLPLHVQKSYNNPSPKIIEDLYLESGCNVNSDFESLKNAPIEGGYSIYGEQALLKHIAHYRLGLRHSILPSLIVKHSLTQINLSKEQRFYALQLTPYDTLRMNFPMRITQYQYHFNVLYNIHDKFFITPSFTTIWYDGSFYYSEFMDNGGYRFLPVTYSGNEQLYSITAGGNLNAFYLELSGNYLSKNNYDHWQTGLNMTWYPLLHKRFYVTAGWHFQPEEASGSNVKDYSVGVLSIGGSVKNIWLEATCVGGNMRNYVEANGSIIYNTVEEVQSKVGGSLTFPLINNKLFVSLYYRYLNYKSSFIYYDNDLVLRDQDYFHNNHSITGGVTWDF